MASKMNFSDKTMIAVVTANGIAAGIQKVVSTVEPAIAPLISVGQLIIVIATVVWIIVRIKGVRLDNKLKEKELNK